MIMDYRVLWNSESVAYPNGNGAHAWLSGSFKNNNSSIYTGGVSASHIPDLSAIGGVWKRIPMNGWDYLRIVGEFVITNLNSGTGGNVQLLPYSMWRGPAQSNAVIRANEQVLGLDFAVANANVIAGTQKLGNHAWNFNSGGTANQNEAIARTSDWITSAAILRGAANQELPLILPTGAVIGQTRRWFYDVGDGQHTGAAMSASFTKTLENGQPLARCSGFPDVYVALKLVNAAAITAAVGSITIAGRVTAIRMRQGGGSQP
jgi:hypothetical protein